MHGAGAEHVVVVLGHQADEVRRALPESVDVVVQEPQLGTGPRGPGRGAARCSSWAPSRVLVHLRRRGARAARQPAAARRLATSVTRRRSRCSPRACAIRTATAASSASRTAASSAWSRSWTPHPKSAPSTKSGAARCSLHAPWLWANLRQTAASPKGEYYLPELVNMARGQGSGVRATLTEDEEEVLGVNDRPSSRKPTPSCAGARSPSCCRSGVTIVDPATTYIEPEVEIEAGRDDSAGLPPARADAHRARLRDRSEHVHRRYVRSAPGRACGSRSSRARTVGERVSIGPFSHLRPGAVIEDDVDARQLRRGQSQPHRRGHPDAPFQLRRRRGRWRRVNIAAGTITVNYNAETRRQEPHGRRGRRRDQQRHDAGGAGRHRRRRHDRRWRGRDPRHPVRRSVARRCQPDHADGGADYPPPRQAVTT